MPRTVNDLSNSFEASSGREVREFLLGRELSRTKALRRFKDEVSKIKVAFVMSSTGITCAFLVSRFFANMFSYLIFRHSIGQFPTDLSPSEVLCVHLSWMLLLWIITPVTFHWFRSHTADGGRSRSIGHDVKILCTQTNLTFAAWGFKDTINSLNTWIVCSCLDVECSTHGKWYPTNEETYWFNSYSSEEISDTSIAFALQFLLLLIALLVAVGFHVSWKLCTVANDQGERPAAYFQRNSPFLLGIGLAISHIYSFCWYFFPHRWVVAEISGSSESSQPGQHYFAAALMVKTFSAALAMLLAIRVTYKHPSGPFNDAESAAVSLGWAVRRAVELLVAALPFAFADQANGWLYEVFFHGIFQCQRPYTKCTEARRFWVWVLYSAMVTVLSFTLVSKVSVSFLNSKLVHSTLLRSDRSSLEVRAATKQLVIALGGYGVGSAYTMTATVECNTDMSPSCPTDTSVINAIKYGVTVVVFVVFIGVSLHFFLESRRLASRVAKVVAIENGNAIFLLKDVTSELGIVAREQVSTLLYDSGLEADVFMAAFDNLEGAEVTPVALMDEVTRLLAALHHKAEALDLCEEAIQDTEGHNEEPKITLNLTTNTLNIPSDRDEVLNNGPRVVAL